jgi:hypothetical protein
LRREKSSGAKHEPKLFIFETGRKPDYQLLDVIFKSATGQADTGIGLNIFERTKKSRADIRSNAALFKEREKAAKQNTALSLITFKRGEKPDCWLVGLYFESTAS